MKQSILLTLAILLLVSVPCCAKVTFDATGTTLIDGKPFFPIGVYLYGFDTDVLAEVHNQGFNTIIWGAKPTDLDTIRQHGLMLIHYSSEEWLAAGKDHPSILGWYLIDEPEDRNKTPEELKKDYDRVRAMDPNHPIGICHYNMTMHEKFKDSEDFVMLSAYPVFKDRSWSLTCVSDHVDNVHKVRGPGVPAWPAIQTFGGPDTDNGRWALPTPAEVRCMTYLVVAHGAKGVLFFSYWPQGKQTWDEVGKLAKELNRLSPYFVLPGKELKATSSDKEIHTRCIKIGNSGILIAVNPSPTFKTVKIKLDNSPTNAFALSFENRRVSLKKGQFTDRFMPYEVHVYQWGETPVL